ncbi:hypothetical protein [Rhizobium sp. NXC14]|uniref:hypothetical protein n=1 Tax=Rhizobium sp. NXC14 TaxID=1981173 RepID=UPI001FDA8078|nr:hypothetical protein [Rhizobium sp. NXC14]
MPIDDTVFWLETVYRRETAQGLWQYRSFRPDAKVSRLRPPCPFLPAPNFRQPSAWLTSA